MERNKKQMNKLYITLLIIFVIVASCGNSQKLAFKDFDNYATSKKPADSILASLQTNNECLLVYAIEDYAWTRTITYHVLANNNNAWKSYFYKDSQNNFQLKSG